LAAEVRLEAMEADYVTRKGRQCHPWRSSSPPNIEVRSDSMCQEKEDDATRGDHRAP
jgi:hypothetical protein